MTYRERREAKAERLREWADKREVKGDATFEKADAIAGMISFGQPILVGHHSEKRHRSDLDRIRGGMDRGMEHSAKAAEFRRRADGIERQADRSIYSDDTDAVERLQEKLAALEAERDRIKAFNATARRGSPDLSLLSERERGDLLNLARVASYQLSKGGGFPGYKLTNLGATIRKVRERLVAFEEGGA